MSPADFLKLPTTLSGPVGPMQGPALPGAEKPFGLPDVEDPELTKAQRQLLEMYGPMFKPQDIPTGDDTESYNAAQSAIDARQAPARPQGMAGVYDKFMNESLNVPMNIKALAGIDPAVANQFMQSTQGMAMANRFGVTPDERAQRDRLQASMSLHGNKSYGRAALAQAIANNNVGMRQADSNFMGGVVRDAGQQAHERLMQQGTRRDARENALIASTMSDLSEQAKSLDTQYERELDKINKDIAAGYYPDEEKANADKEALTAKYEDAKTQLSSYSSNLRNKLLSGDMSALGGASPAASMSGIRGGVRAPEVNRSPLNRDLQQELKQALMDSSGGPFRSKLEVFLDKLPDRFRDDRGAKAAAREFIARNFTPGERSAVSSYESPDGPFSAAMDALFQDVPAWMGLPTDKKRAKILGKVTAAE